MAAFKKKRFCRSNEILLSWLYLCKASNKYWNETFWVVPYHEKYAGKWSIENDFSKMLLRKWWSIGFQNIMAFPEGSKEAVLAFHTKKDGKIISSETGATPLK